MKRTTAVIAALGLLTAGSGARAAETFNIDPVHSTIGFSVVHLVINTVHGKFTEFNGALEVDGNALQSAKGTIQTKSVDTGVAARDKDLRSANFFDVEKYPSITFQSKRVEKRGSETVIVGDFTMHGVTKELTLPAKLSGPITDPWGNKRVGLHAETKINRKEYGLTYSKALETGGLVVGDEIGIEINAEATRAK